LLLCKLRNLGLRELEDLGDLCLCWHLSQQGLAWIFLENRTVLAKTSSRRIGCVEGIGNSKLRSIQGIAKINHVLSEGTNFSSTARGSGFVMLVLSSEAYRNDGEAKLNPKSNE